MSPASCAFPALGTTAMLCVTRREALPGARDVLERTLAAVDGTCSRFRVDSELSRVNARPGVEVAVGELLFEAITVALRAAAATDGLVDPTVGRSMRLAGYDRTFELVARDARGPRFVPAAGWQRVELNADRRTVRLPAGAEIDLGATAKALAADRAAAEIAAHFECGALVSLGGDIAVAGSAPAAGWTIRIADDHAAPLDSSGPVVSIRTGGLASSGTAVRRWRAGGTQLHHIVDPRTGRPAATPWRTVTVAAASCVDANLAATAAIVLGAAAPAWLAARNLPSRLLSETGVATQIAGWPEEDLAA